MCFFNGCVQMADVFPDLHYQVGATPDGVENARNHCKVMEAYPAGDKPLTKCPPGNIPPPYPYPYPSFHPLPHLM
jgi:hypothetical protein